MDIKAVSRPLGGTRKRLVFRGANQLPRCPGMRVMPWFDLVIVTVATLALIAVLMWNAQLM